VIDTAHSATISRFECMISVWQKSRELSVEWMKPCQGKRQRSVNCRWTTTVISCSMKTSVGAILYALRYRLEAVPFPDERVGS
jgi:hypothetical protein